MQDPDLLEMCGVVQIFIEVGQLHALSRMPGPDRHARQVRV